MSYPETILEDLQNVVDDLLTRSARICLIAGNFMATTLFGSFCPDAKPVGQAIRIPDLQRR